MYIKYMTTGDGCIKREQVNEIYSSRVSFYRGVKYLIDSGYIEREELRINVPVFRLTASGQLLARLLCSLSDNPKEIKELSSALRF
jgi:hypothetical protein